MTEASRGHLKIFMGYAAGVGKTYKMLEEAQSLKASGKDVVIAYFEPRGRQDTISLAAGFEVIPRKKINYNGRTAEELDTGAILARHPQTCIVDELAHNNAPGSERAKRWEDVTLLLDAGIDVLTTLDIQNLESLNDEVRHITGVTIRETVPDWMVQRADEVVMIDVTPRALLHRLDRGVVYKDEDAQHARQNFFTEPTLVALRELALREAAHEVEHRIPSDEAAAETDKEPGRTPRKPQKILVYLTADPKTAMVTRRAKRVSDFLGVDCLAVAVRPANGSGNSARDREAIETHLNFARNLHIETQILEGNDAASLLLDFARKNQVTQIFVARPQSSGWSPLLSRHPVRKLIGMAKDMQVVIVSDRDPMKRR
jgi:two-component system sensor histidine kinase KdpD